MERTQGRTSSYVMSDIGATPLGPMALLAAALQDGRDVLRERDVGGGRRRLLRA